MTLYSCRIENGGADKLTHELVYVHGVTTVIQMFMAATERPDLYRFTVQRVDNVELEIGDGNKT